MNTQGAFAKNLSAGAYTVYIIHPFILVILGLSMQSWEAHPSLKFVLLAPVSVALSFLIAWPIRLLPFARKIL